MAKLILTSKFKGSCLICNCMPVDEDDANRKPLQMIHAVGVDVNWGEDLNICQICAGVMADMLGRPDELKVKTLSKTHRDLAEKYRTLAEEHEALQGRMNRMIDGKKAIKEQRESS